MAASEEPAAARGRIVRRFRALRGAVAAIALVLGTGCGSGIHEEALTPSATATEAGPQLVDVAAEVGLDFRHGAFRSGPSPDAPAMMGGGLCWLDYDDDGWLDLFVVDGYAQSERDEWLAAGGLPTSRLFRNDEGRFEDVTQETGAGLELRGQGCVAADLDLDGHTDLYVTGADRSTLLWNDRGLEFEEASEETGVAVFGWHTGAAAGDVDGDGWPDLVVSAYVDLANRVTEPQAALGFPNTYLGSRDLLFLSTGRSEDGRVAFREVGERAGLEVTKFAYGLGVVLHDLERDGDLDVYVANDTNPNRLYETVQWPGGAEADPAGLGFRFEERAGPAGVADPGSGMGIAAEDWSGDGRADLFVSNSRGQVHAVYRSNPPDENDPSLADVRETLGPDLSRSTGWGVTWLDLDLDRDLDLFLANGRVPVTDLAGDAEPLYAYRNLAAEGEPGRFEDAGAALGLDKIGPLLARGSAAADYDNDGDLDVAVLEIGGPLVLLENRVADGNRLVVELEGSPPGVEVTVALPGGGLLRRTVHAGSSYLSSEDPRLHFGLGASTSAQTVTIRWPDGETTRLEDVPSNRLLKVDAP
jgi:ASPIC and UnbV/FG-GAP-like repeat